MGNLEKYVLLGHDTDRPTTVTPPPMIPVLFDLDERYALLEKLGDPLPKLNRAVDWEAFRPLLAQVYDKPRKSKAGRKPYDVVLMFKVLVIQRLYNLSDDQVEYPIRDR